MFNITTYLDYSQALCAQTDPELFFPEAGASARPAKQICDVCPVKNECLLEALANEYSDGIWGGLTASERKALRRSQGLVVTTGRGRRKGVPNVHKRIRSI